MKHLITYIIFVLILFIRVTHAGDSFIENIADGKFYTDIRFRNEFVDQDGLTENTHSRTARTRLGYKTGKFHDFVAVIEGENVFSLANNNFNDTVNGKTEYPVVADPENTQINQAYGEYTGITDTIIKGGRQIITIDNHRFIGHVGWRQNNQVFDAATITNKSIPEMTLKYGFIYNVNRIFGEKSSTGDWGSKSHFYNISNTSFPFAKITVYGYMLDFGSDSAANSNQTYGGSLSTNKKLNDDFTLKCYAEYALQSDYADNTVDYSANYYHLAVSIVWKGLTTTFGDEVLGSDDNKFAFRTPLATGHKFNGWADKFLTTPADGLKDLFIDLTYKVKNLNGTLKFFNGMLTKLQYHDFKKSDGVSDHGNELGVYIKQPINKHVYVEIKYANYNAENTATDTQKFVTGIGVKL